MAIYYFGYGSNMSSEMMTTWCPAHILIGKGQLLGYQLAFTRLSDRWGAGVADIISKDDCVVWGGLYQVSDSDIQALDEKESNGVHYQRIACQIVVDSKTYDAFTYEVINKARDGIPTSTTYRDTMLAGARELQLPDAYIKHIENLPVGT